MGTTPDSDEALLLSGEVEDFGRFYDRYVRDRCWRSSSAGSASPSSRPT